MDTPVSMEQAERKLAEILDSQPDQIKTTQPPDTSVIFPGGFIAFGSRDVIKNAEVRELTGVDEEAIAKAPTPAKQILSVLRRGVVSIGDHTDITTDLLDQLLIGDRDTLLIAIRSVTFGQTLEAVTVCYGCNTRETYTVDLIADVPNKPLDDPIADRVWTVKCKVGEVKLTLPTGAAGRQILENSDKTFAEMNTILLAECIRSVNGVSSMGATTALSLGMGDRSKLIEEILSHNPGPKLGEVSKTCDTCEAPISIPLGITDLFPF